MVLFPCIFFFFLRCRRLCFKKLWFEFVMKVFSLIFTLGLDDGGRLERVPQQLVKKLRIEGSSDSKWIFNLFLFFKNCLFSFSCRTTGALSTNLSLYIFIAVRCLYFVIILFLVPTTIPCLKFACYSYLSLFCFKLMHYCILTAINLMLKISTTICNKEDDRKDRIENHHFMKRKKCLQ